MKRYFSIILAIAATVSAQIVPSTGNVRGPTSATDNAVARYDGTTGKVVQNSAVTIDDSGNTTAADVILGTSGPSVKSSLSARAPRQGLVFDGTAGATVASVPAFGTADFTFSGVINSKTIPALTIITEADSNGFGLRFESNGLLVAYQRGGLDKVTATTAITAGKSVAFSYVRSSGVGTFYINGIAAGTNNDGTNYSAGNYVLAPSGNLTGTLSVLIYNRALSASEVLALYEAGAPSGADYPSKAAGVTINSSAWTNLTYDSLTSANGGTFTAVKASSVGYVTSAPTAPAIKKGTKIRVSGVLTLNNGKTVKPEVYIDEAGATIQPINVASGASFSYELTAVTNSATNITFQTAGDADYTISSLVITSLGLLLAPDAQQVGGGSVWADTSGNAAHITLPGSGVSWNVPSQIGEYVDAELTFSNRTALTDSTAKNVTSITLTAGDWDVTGVIGYYAISATALNFYSGTNTTSATFGADRSYAQRYTVLTAATTGMKDAVPVNRIAITSTTTVYLVARADFSAGTVEAWGYIRARRVR